MFIITTLSIGWMVASSLALLPRFRGSTVGPVNIPQKNTSLFLSGLFGEQAILDRKREALESSVVSASCAVVVVVDDCCLLFNGLNIILSLSC